MLTGFDRFGKLRSNLSEIVVQHIRENPPRTIQLETLVLPTEFYRASRILADALYKRRPDYCVCLGVASHSGLKIERLAINVNSTYVPDNAGRLPTDEEINPDGPPAYWVTLPVPRVLEALRANTIPAAISYFAGTYVCNHVLYAALDQVQRKGLPTKVGFIHLPNAISRAKQGNKVLTLSSMIRAIEITLEVLGKAHE